MNHFNSSLTSSTPPRPNTSLKKRLWRWVVAILLLVLASLWGIGEFMLKTSLRPNASRYRDAVVTVDTMLRIYPHIQPWYDSLQAHHALHDTTIIAADGEKLHGYYIRAATPTPRVALLVHGYGDAGLRMLHIAYLYHHNLGVNVVMPDLRYHGKTHGASVGMGWNDRLDVRLWAQKVPEILGNSLKTATSSTTSVSFSVPRVNTHPQRATSVHSSSTSVPHPSTSVRASGASSMECSVVSVPHIVVHGISMGAATTMMLSGTDSLPPIRAYVEDCGYTSVWDIFASELKKRYHLPTFPVMHVTSALSKWHYGWNFREADAEEAVRRCRQPMLFIHGDKDTFVPTAMVYRVYAAKPQPKSLWVALNSPHAFSYHDHPAEYTRRVARFLASYW